MTVAKDFEYADVVSFKFSRIEKVTKCCVTVRDADKKLVTWRLVDDSVSTDRWEKVPDPSTSGTTSGFHQPLGAQGSCADRVVFDAIKSALKKGL